MVDGRGDLLEHPDVVAYEPEKRRAPGAECDRIEQRYRAEWPPLEQMGSERDRPTEVVPDDRRLLELPVIEQLGEQPRLGAERDVLVVPLLRRPVAQQVVGVHGPFARELRDHVAPEVG